MPDEREASEASKDRLAEGMPDPNGSPQPVKKSDPVLGLIATLGVVAVAIGGALGVSYLTTGHTSGATRSAKLQWAERQQLIQQAQQQEQAGQQPAPQQLAGENVADDATAR